MKLFTQLTLEVKSLTKSIVRLPLQLSIALTNEAFGSGIAAEQLRLSVAGHVTVGARLSNTVII